MSIGKIQTPMICNNAATVHDRAVNNRLEIACVVVGSNPHHIALGMFGDRLVIICCGLLTTTTLGLLMWR